MNVNADMGMHTVNFVLHGDPVEYTRRLADVGPRLQALEAGPGSGRADGEPSQGPGAPVDTRV